MAELTGDVQEGLLAMAVGAALQMMAAMNVDVEEVCGPRGRHYPDRTATRHGSGSGSVTLGGRRVPVTRPRMRSMDGSGELRVASYELFSRTEVLGRMAMQRVLAGLSTRRYPVGLEPVGQKVEAAAHSTSMSAVSRRNDRGQQAVPPRQRPPAPAPTTRRPRCACRRRNRRCGAS